MKLLLKMLSFEKIMRALGKDIEDKNKKIEKELDDFDKAFIQLLARRTPYPTWEIEPIYKGLNKSMDSTLYYIQLATAHGFGCLYNLEEKVDAILGGSINAKEAAIGHGKGRVILYE